MFNFILLTSPLFLLCLSETLTEPKCKTIRGDDGSFCDPKKCKGRFEPPQCCKSGYTTLGYCRCCKACAKAEGEICGGQYDLYGTCAPGLSCHYKRVHGGPSQNGICKKFIDFQEITKECQGPKPYVPPITYESENENDVTNSENDEVKFGLIKTEYGSDYSDSENVDYMGLSQSRFEQVPTAEPGTCFQMPWYYCCAGADGRFRCSGSYPPWGIGK